MLKHTYFDFSIFKSVIYLVLLIKYSPSYMIVSILNLNKNYIKN
jgi:hypothetical protein